MILFIGGWDPLTHPERKTWHPDLKAIGATIQFVRDTARFEEETAERREPEPEGKVTPEGIEVPRRRATWEKETPESGERTHDEEEASQIGETSQRADARSQRVVELQGLRMARDRTG